MAIRWSEVTFGDVLLGGTRNGIYKKKEFHGSGVKIVNMGELFAHSRLFSISMKRVELSEKEKANSCLEQGDLIFARRSLVAEGAGKCSIVMEIDEPTTFESSIIRARPDPEKLDSLFAYYLFNSPYGKYLLGSILRQVAVAGITGSDLVQLKIPHPPLRDQQAIAHIFGSFDDKIELNRQMNETLEAMARAIFKSWFVDFDPVRAKAEGRDPGLPKEIADLFPDSFEDSELGEIPRGWEVSKVEKIAEKVACGPFGSSIKVSTFVSEGIPVISGQHLHGIRLLDEGNNSITPEHAQKLKNANVFRGDVIFTHAGNIGQVSFIPETSKYEQYVLSQRQFYLRCNKKIVSPIYVAHYFNSPNGQSQLLANTSSTGVPSISRPVSYLKSISFMVPIKQIIDSFSDLVQPLHVFAAMLEAESRTLSSLRDTLLPKLISGELRIPNVEKFIKEAGL